MKNIIAGYRTMLGLTQQDLANKLGISRQAYSLKEKGRTPFSDSEKILIRDLVSEVVPNISIDSIFFNGLVRNAKKNEEGDV